jgi:hypothetical protein
VRKKLSIVIPLWVVILAVIIALYLLKEVSPVKEFLSWAVTYWVILAALVGGGIALTTYIIKRKPSQLSKEVDTRVCTITKAAERASAIWGLWYTGEGWRVEGLLEEDKIKRLLLLNPSTKNPTIEQNATIVSCSPKELRDEINIVKDAVEINHIPYKLYSLPRQESFTIFDPTPIPNEKSELIPNSEKAWICIQFPSNKLKREDWPIKEYKNIGKNKKTFEKYFNEFEDIWNNKSVESKDIEKPFEDASLQIDNEKKQKAQIKSDLGVLIIEGADVLRGFKSVKTFGDIWPEQEFKGWREKVYKTLIDSKFNDYYALFFKDTCIDISQAILSDYIGACEAGLNRLEELLKRQI